MAAAFLRISGLCVALALSDSSHAQPVFPGEPATRNLRPNTVISGRITRIGFYWSINEDCSNRGLPQIDVTGAPRSGSLTFEDKLDFPNISPGPYYHCNARRVMARSLWYRSQRGFEGTDQIQVQVRFVSGRTANDIYTIRVLR